MIRAESVVTPSITTYAASIRQSVLRAIAYWLGLPIRWTRQVFRNGRDILRVLDLTRARPMKAGMVGLDHPWVTGVDPTSGDTIWQTNVIHRSPRDESREDLPSDDVVLKATGAFLAERVRQSAVTPELPIGPKRRMPHCVNYMHGVSHYNSGIILLNDLRDGYRHITDPKFRRELKRFVRVEKREILFLFRDRDYHPREFAYLSCCMRSIFPWFCNPNGPRGRVLWGNAAPFASANLITGHWADDVYALRAPDGAARVARPPLKQDAYFRAGPYDQGRDRAIWPEKALAWLTYWRVRIRGAKGGMFFIDRRQVYADQIRNRAARGLADEPVTPL